MKCISHTIELKNIDQSICYSRRILLIIGVVKNSCDKQLLEYQWNDSKTFQQKLFNGNFKLLVKLEKDTCNVLKINYCENTLAVNVYHKSIDPVFYDIQPLYIIPKHHDGRFQSDNQTSNSAENALDRINLILELAQCLYSSKIYEAESQEKAFVLQKCQIFHSNIAVEDAWGMSQWDLYDRVAKDLIDKFGSDIERRRKFVGFMSCTKYTGLDINEDYNYPNIKNKTKASPSLGSGFLALLGSGCFYALPDDVASVIDAFENKKSVDVTKLLDDSNYRKTYNGCFSTFLGSLVHEMGHIFDLGHTNTGLMGTDIDFVHRFFFCQNFTEIMPKRIISNCQQTEKPDDSLASNRITKIKKNGFYMEKYHEQKNKDMTFFETNCLITLMSHKWFNQNNRDDFLSFNDRVISSKVSELVLIELRESRDKNSILKRFWDVRDQRIKQFCLPDDAKLDGVTLIALNHSGCLLKIEF